MPIIRHVVTDINPPTITISRHDLNSNLKPNTHVVLKEINASAILQVDLSLSPGSCMINTILQQITQLGVKDEIKQISRFYSKNFSTLKKIRFSSEITNEQILLISGHLIPIIENDVIFTNDIGIFNDEETEREIYQVEREKPRLQKLIGVNDIIDKIMNNNNLNIFYLHGPSGNSKSTICKYIAQDSTNRVINCFSLLVNSNLKKLKIPTNINHVLCLNFCDLIADSLSLSSLFDLIYEYVNRGKECNIYITSTKPVEDFPQYFQRFVKNGLNINIPYPNYSKRFQIICEIFSNHHFNTQRYHDKIIQIANRSSGYVFQDLYKLIKLPSCEDILDSFSLSNDSDLLSVFDKCLTEIRESNLSSSKEIDNNIIKWDDIIGYEETKRLLQQSTEWPISHSHLFKQFALEPPSGVLLYGPPGCSKTMLAKAVATNSLNCNFLYLDASSIYSKYVGDSEASIREIFQKARQTAPCVVFIDEIDTISGNDEGGLSNRITNTFLTEMDGMKSTFNNSTDMNCHHSLGEDFVLILAATNKPEKLDRALLRPGRFDRLVYVGLPEDDCRRQILKKYIEKVNADINEDEINTLVNRTRHFSGAEVVNINKEAAMRAMTDSIYTSKPAVLEISHYLRVLDEFKSRIDLELVNRLKMFK